MKIDWSCDKIILLTKEGENISYINEQASFGIDLIKNENELIKTFITYFDELDLDAFALNINKLNKNGQNYIFTAQDVNKNVINYAKENDIKIYAKKDLISLIKKHKITKNNLLSLVFAICGVSVITLLIILNTSFNSFWLFDFLI